MAQIHPTACVDASAQIADDAVIGPHCVVGPRASIGAGCRLVAHVHVAGRTSIGPRTQIFPFASLGTPPQSVRYRGGDTQLLVGADCNIREGATLNIGTEDGGGVTEVGDRCFMMAGSHVGHDCKVGNDVTFANNAVLGGHVTVGDFCFFGGNAAVHQFVRVGEGAMIGGLSGVRTDLIPFGYAVGQLADLVGLNVVGLKRRGFTRADMHRLRRAYQMLFSGAGVFRDRIDATAREFGGDPIVGRIVTFIQEGGDRSLMQPAKRRDADDGGDAAPS
jgi:UDP-N-acetylglucosamine acyltransferase